MQDVPQTRLMPSGRIRAVRFNSRRARKREMKARGVTPCIRQFVWRVEPSVIAMPGWAVSRAIRVLSGLWLPASVGRKVAELDRAEGGNPEVAELEFRYCDVCSRPLVGSEAVERRRLNEISMTGRQLPCGPDCFEHQKSGRWRKERAGKWRY